jgi:hypothetical protein
MIAPARFPSSDTDRPRRAIRRARRLVAQSLLASPEPAEERVSPVPVWQAWLVAIWMLMVAGVFLAAMFKWWRGG